VVVVLSDGADGTAASPFGLRMFNPDGSEFERSGNGLRIAASWLLDRGRVEPGTPFSVRVGGSTVEMEVHGRSPSGVADVSVEMGRARVGPEAVELDPEALDLPAPGGAHGWLETSATGPLPVHLVSVGNPHCVVFVGALCEESEVPGCFSAADLARMGPGLATHPGYAHGTNVQLARTPGDGRVQALIWERGVGPTLASGTSACAVAVASVASGRLEPGAVRVEMEGGALEVTVGAELEVRLRGPVQEVGTLELSPRFVAALEAASAA
jgi:diaminopimelate epimerase